MGHFLTHNPTEANQETDSAFNSDSLRTGGVGVNALLPSAFLNKLWHQSSVFCAAFDEMMLAKGITLDDADQNALAAALAAIVTTTNGLNITNSTFATGAITGSTINSTPIGVTTPAVGDFTQLNAAQFSIAGVAPVGATLVGDGAHYTSRILTRSGNLVGSRSSGVIYQNTSGGEMDLSGWFTTAGGSGNIGDCFVNVGPTTSLGNIVWKNQSTATVAGGAAAFYARICPGEYYQVGRDGDVASLSAWFESTYQ